ncbi:MAG: hypothetical protein P8H03_04955 [Emcibacteraceae bacterium]|nr:hypothetical protein [Emcibacteraceae bacterium]MDG1859290.1 hypothetical protein [Emcibacteraceae bacterium]
MKNIIIKNIVSLSILLLVSASHASEVEIPNTGITFEAPENFMEIPKNIRDLKWNSLNAPKFAIGNETASTTIAYDIKPNDISQAPLDELLNYFSSTFDRIIPGLIWHKKEIINLSDQEWVFLEMTSSAVDTDIYNIMLVTSYNNQMLLFNFNSTKKDFSTYEEELRESIRTIKLPRK